MKNIKVLEDLYDSAIEKRREARENIIVNEDRIREIDEFLNQAKETEEDIRLFTPRNLDEAFPNRIQRGNDERSMLIERNENLFNIVNDLDQQIRQLRELMADLDSSEENPSKTTVSLKNVVEEILVDQPKDTQEIVDESKSGEPSEHDEVISDDDLYNRLDELRYDLEMISSYMIQDSNRAKIALDECITKLNDLLSDCFT